MQLTGAIIAVRAGTTSVLLFPLPMPMKFMLGLSINGNQQTEELAGQILLTGHTRHRFQDNTLSCDIHKLIYPAGGTKIYTGTDGGVFYSTNGGSTWTDISNGLGITQCYAMGGTESNASLIVAGMQDNGINEYTGSTTWTQLYGADGFECAVDFTNASVMYAEVYNGSLMKSTDGGNTWATDVQPSWQ